MLRDSKAKELLAFLSKGGIWNTSELAKELSVDKKKVTNLVQNVRKHFLKGEEGIPYIFTTGIGYTLEEKPEHTAYETKMRMQHGYGVLMNGVYVFKRCKQIAPKMFEGLSIAFKPKMLTVARLIQKESKNEK